MTGRVGSPHTLTLLLQEALPDLQARSVSSVDLLNVLGTSMRAQISLGEGLCPCVPFLQGPGLTHLWVPSITLHKGHGRPQERSQA